MDRWLSNINVVRVIALLLGVLLWAVVHMDISKSEPQPNAPVASSSSETTTSVAIERVGLDESRYHLISISPTTVTLTSKGKPSALRQITPANYKVYADLSGVIEGAQIVPLKVEKENNFPDGVTLQVDPASVTVKIETVQKKEMPVVIELKGSPSEGMQEGTPIVTPNRVHVSVPESELDLVHSVKATVDIDGAKSAVNTQVKLTAYDESGKELKVDISPAVVDVEVPITSPFKTMPLQIQLVGQLPEGYGIDSLTQSTSQITVYGPQAVLDQLEFYSGLQIDLTGLNSDKTIDLDIPLKDKITRVEPDRVSVSLKIVPSATKTFKDVGITLSGENNKYQTSVIKPAVGKVDVTLEGAQDVLDKVKPEDIQAIVDVSNLPVGKYDLPVVLNLPQFVRKAPGQDQDLTVSIEVSEKAEGTGAEPDQSTPGPNQPTETEPTETTE